MRRATAPSTTASSRCALKRFFTAASLDAARSVIGGLGGVMHDERWGGQGFTACNVVDREGNVVQLREI